MLHTPENSRNKKLVDCRGREIKFVKSFDDETMEAEILIACGENTVAVSMGKILSVKVKIPDAKIVVR